MMEAAADFILGLRSPSTVWVGATLLVLGLAVRRAEWAGLDTLLMFAAGVAGLIGAWVGGYWYCLVDAPHLIVKKPWLLVQVLEGPKAMFGALVGTGLCGAGLLWAMGGSVRTYADVAAPAIALGYAVYRLGCFWHGCELGTATDLPWAVAGSDGTATHPVAAYHALVGLGLYLSLRPMRVGTGRVALLALGGYGFLRFGLEFVRVEPVSWLGLNPGHWWSLLAVVMAIGGTWIFRKCNWPRYSERVSILEASEA